MADVYIDRNLPGGGSGFIGNAELSDGCRVHIPVNMIFTSNIKGNGADDKNGGKNGGEKVDINKLNIKNSYGKINDHEATSYLIKDVV